MTRSQSAAMKLMILARICIPDVTGGFPGDGWYKLRISLARVELPVVTSLKLSSSCRSSSASGSVFSRLDVEYVSAWFGVLVMNVDSDAPAISWMTVAFPFEDSEFHTNPILLVGECSISIWRQYCLRLRSLSSKKIPSIN